MKNYTSKVPAAQSIMNIERELVSIGANRIVKDYDEHSKVNSIAFVYHDPSSGEVMSFQLPANVYSTWQVMSKEKSTSTKAANKKMMDQAERTAWKNVHDWVRAQVVLIQLRQVEFMQVFLPFALVNIDHGTTVYDVLKGRELSNLLNPPTCG